MALMRVWYPFPCLRNQSSTSPAGCLGVQDFGIRVIQTLQSRALASKKG
jgi:hypothetical protein